MDTAKLVIRVRWRRYFRRGGKIWLRETLALVVDPAGKLTLVSAAVILFLVFLAFGTETAISQLVSWAASNALILAVPLLLVLNLITAAVRAPAEEAMLGQWVGSRFVYHHPLHVLTTIVTEKNNDQLQVFKVTDAEVGSLVEVVVNIDRNDEKVKAQTVWPKSSHLVDWNNIRRITKMRLQLPEDRILGLKTFADPDADETTIRVSIASFEVGNNTKSSIIPISSAGRWE